MQCQIPEFKINNSLMQVAAVFLHVLSIHVARKYHLAHLS